LVATAPPFDSYPLHPFPPLQPALHYITMTTSTISVFFVWDYSNHLTYLQTLHRQCGGAEKYKNRFGLK
jgi:hypothetical protein